MAKKQFTTAKELLHYLNNTYAKLHTSYERYFWDSYMGNAPVDQKMNKAMEMRDKFRSSSELKEIIDQFVLKSKGNEKKRLEYWKLFFSKYQTPEHVLPIKKKIADLESKIRSYLATRKEGYYDPKTTMFVEASENKMQTIVQTHEDEAVRKACFDAMEELAKGPVDDYIELIQLRNVYARELGYDDFYEFKVINEEGMTKKELFALFDDIYEKTNYAFKSIRKLEEKMPGLRKPWNFGYIMAGDFTKEEDPYYQFDEALLRWGASFAALGINFQGGKLKLDLLDRKKKWNNGFCHWPELVEYKEGKRIPGSSNFTCNVVYGQTGSGAQGIHTLFHEGGHAAHLLNSTMEDVCINHEYPPAATSWAETQSMFCDSIFGSIEWRMRYAKDKDGNLYPFDLFKRKIQKIYPLLPLGMMGILFVSNFERTIYEAKDLTKDKVFELARSAYKKYFDKSEDSLRALNVPHIYGFESSAAYHGYGLAELAVSQWRDYFYKKYGYIVDNPNVGKEMTRVWKLAASLTLKEFVILATGKKISSKSYVDKVTKPLDKIFKNAQIKIKKMEKVKKLNKPVNLNASITLVHGNEKIADSKKGFEAMALKYKNWLNSNTHTH